ncbi:hypothetical protein SODALDRAFT_334369 [Sodiomyces alkalinus F11]|uniref:Uncharacterized protein n=1 Tax=Sodiomyces alkalinus (strain CBS 110278 / VKM F-3762 / F11) TaxID=1314773 RepID=A0A3N2PRZ7_SODAK|nr:hypothetical protein SODALDRAFT_334369 [Sodiomyces alkalinus F11]ROT37283.1 hypothetical protein SODALDRAFT_334369 [Sodiomyces alkalinus F11]
MTPNVEILAHATAPAMSSDDARYRSLASAYLAFIPSARTTVISRSWQAQEPSRTPRSSNDVGAQGCEASFPGSISLESPQLSFASVLDNAGSPRVTVGMAALPPEGTLEPSQASRQDSSSSQMEDSWLAPPSTIPDSLPMNDIRLSGFTSPRRLIEHFLGDFQSTQAESQSSSSSRAGSSRRERACSTQVSSSQSELDVALPTAPDDDDVVLSRPGARSSGRSDSSIVPATPPRPLEVSHVEEHDHEAGNGTVIEDTVFEDGEGVADDVPGFVFVTSRKRTLSPLRFRADSEPAPPKRHRGTAAACEDVMTPPPRLLRSSSEGSLGLTMDDALERGRRYLERFNPPHLYATELHSPAPRVSNDVVTPDDFVTPHLEKLAADLDTCSQQPSSQEQGSRFASVEMRRQLSPFERGYWFIDCSAWTDDLPQLMWCSLAKFVSGEGVAGWGTWCCRDEDWRWVRVYCFGHVARHVYFLLYASSYRKSRTARASWIDAAGEVVLVMEGT